MDIHLTTGEPLHWDNEQKIEYWLDPGSLGRFSNEQVRILIMEAMKIWENASPNANPPKFEFAGYLPEDVNGTNYQKYVTRATCYTNDLAACETEAQQNLQTVIVLDDDNQVSSGAKLCGLSSCTAVAGVRVIDGDASNLGFARQGIVVFTSALGSKSFKVRAVMGIFVHELGHLLGLAHTSVNQGAYIEGDDELARYIPTMFSLPIINADDPFMVSLSPDDIAGISVLYPSETFSQGAATIKGKILKSGGSPMMHVNVIARNQEDPLCEAYSFLSGRLCKHTAIGEVCIDDNQIATDNSEYVISGLPSGSYTLEVEEVADDNLALTLAPGLVDPFIFGDAEFWNEGDAANEPNTLSSTITLAAGETRENVDIVLNRSEVTEDRIKYLPLNTFAAGPGTRCPEEPPIDYAALIGIDESDPAVDAPSVSSGGCNLVRQ